MTAHMIRPGRTPDTAPASPEEQIRSIVEEQMRAIRVRDADAAMALCAPDMSSFDVVPPLRNQGAAAVRERLEGWFASFAGPIDSEIRELETAVDGDVAFCHGLQRFTGSTTGGAQIDMWVRVTLGLRRRDGRWLIVHEHMSDPFDPETGHAMTTLKP